MSSRNPHPSSSGPPFPRTPWQSPHTSEGENSNLGHAPGPASSGSGPISNPASSDTSPAAPTTSLSAPTLSVLADASGPSCNPASSSAPSAAPQTSLSSCQTSLAVPQTSLPARSRSFPAPNPFAKPGFCREFEYTNCNECQDRNPNYIGCNHPDDPPNAPVPQPLYLGAVLAQAQQTTPAPGLRMLRVSALKALFEENLNEHVNGML